MSRKKKPEKIRADLRKKHDTRPRRSDVTRDFRSENVGEEKQSERISGKGDLTRKRTVMGESTDEGAFSLKLDVDEDICLPGRVLEVYGLTSDVLADNGRRYRCATRGLLKTLSTDQRHVIAAGDRVMIRPEGEASGCIERIEPRHGVLNRTVRGRQAVIVTNVDQLLIIASAAQPDLKPHLIDRMLVTAHRNGIEPVIVINKVDLIDPASLQPIVGVYGQLGYKVLLVSAETGFQVDRLKRLIAGRESVVAGQSGVGKSSILNAIQPGLQLRVREVSAENEKGRHTTTSAVLVPLESGGFIVDTPGIRQFQLWGVVAEEVGGFFRDIRPFINRCRFPDCTHTHEDECAVKEAVADSRLDLRRYESYCHMFAGDDE